MTPEALRLKAIQQPSALTTGWHNIDADLCVLGSGSRGNCSVLRLHQRRLDPSGDREERYSLCLIDLGFSPKWTITALNSIGCDISQVDTVLITHLDMDHCHPRWSDGLPRHAEVFVPRGHLPRAYQRGLHKGVLAHFAGQGRQPTGQTSIFQTLSGLRVEALMTFHDELGSAVFRITVPIITPTGPQDLHLGYATDLGRATDELLDFLRADAPATSSRFVSPHQLSLFDALPTQSSVSNPRPRLDILAIESNYCPNLQAASDRPMFLKQRITGGRGHLSNQESAEIACCASPAKAAVLLHLSRVCNRPEIAREVHQQAMAQHTSSRPLPSWQVLAADQIEPTPWISFLSGQRRGSQAAAPDATTADDASHPIALKPGQPSAASLGLLAESKSAAAPDLGLCHRANTT